MTSNLNDPRSRDPEWSERIRLSDGFSVTREFLELGRCIAFPTSRGPLPLTMHRGRHRTITVARVRS